MNRLFGSIDPQGHAAQSVQRLGEWLQQSGHGVGLAVRESHLSTWGSIQDGGGVLGEAEQGSLRLCYLGALYGPLPGWSADLSPLDDPAQTAAYLLERFRSEGPRFLDGLYGQFAVVLEDTTQGEVWLGCDASGGRRLFCSDSTSPVLHFSTQLADFRGLDKHLTLDRSWEDFFLAHEFIPGGGTCFQGVRSLPPGTLRRIKRTESGLELENYAIAKVDPWSDWLPNLELETEEQVVDALEKAFFRALEEQSPSGSRVGLMLGGFDSALIAAALTKQGKEVETFSFQYPDSSYNQAFTEELARLLGIRHHWVPMTANVMRSGFEQFEHRFNQAVCQPHYLIATEHAAQAVRNAGFLQCFTGDGCDGLFLGYPTVHQRAVLIDRLSKVAPILRRVGGPVVRNGFLERRFGHPYRVARNVLRVLERPMPTRAHIASNIVDDFSLSQLRLDKPPRQERPIEEVLAELANGLDDVSTVRLAYKGKGAVGLNRNKLEGCTASAGISLQSPFLHPGMAKLAAMLPEELNRPSRPTKAEATGKYALMLMAEQRRYLPTEMIYQKKRSPVTAPVDAWYMKDLRSTLLRQFDRLPFNYDRKYAEALLDHKLTEDAFRKYIGISRYAFHAPALLATYASFTGEGK